MANPNLGIASALEELAAFLRTHELPDIGFIPTIHVYAATKEDFIVAAKNMGSFEKSVGDTHFDLTKKFPLGATINLFCNRELVCEKVKVGEKVLPATPETVIPAKPEITVDVFEYRCPDSLLGIQLDSNPVQESTTSDVI